MHLAPLIRDLAVILAVAGLVTLLFQRIRQPVVLGYIIAGTIIGPNTPPFPLVTDIPNIKILAELGVVFLMFSLGLEFSFRKLLKVGGPAAFTAVFEVIFMLACGFVTGRALGWSNTDSIFLGGMLSISSTTIIIKALDELGLKTRRFAELVFGILIVEDLVAILLLVALTTLVSGGGLSAFVLAHSMGKLALVVGSWFLAGYLVVPRFMRYVATFRSDEMLVVSSLGLCLTLVVIAAHFHYSAALGAFIMGSILAESAESHRIEELVKPLRDVFAAIFFVSVGMLIDPAALWQHKGAIAAITAVTIVGKLVSTSLGPLLAGQPLKSSVLVGFSLAQIGEFSFIIATLGLSLGAMSEFLYPIIVAVSLVTTFTTPYLIALAPRFAEAAEKRLPPRARTFLDRYAAWRATQASRAPKNPALRRGMTRWAISAFIVVLANVLVVEYGLALLERVLGPRDLAWGVGWAISLLVSAPFVWSMLTALPSHRSSPEYSRAPALLAQLLTLGLLGLMSLFYLDARYVGVATALAGIFLFSRLLRQLEASYRWFEGSFLAAFDGHHKHDETPGVYRQLAPWDAHLVKIRVHPDANIAGQRLLDVELRKRVGINVVAIQRGSRTIVAPRPEEQIFPQDELLVLGTDEQLDRARSSIESPVPQPLVPASIEGYELRRLLIHPESPMLGTTIRSSGLRNRYGAMVVGVERRGNRIMNPDSDLAIEKDDILSLVGESSRLDELLEAMGQAATTPDQ